MSAFGDEIDDLTKKLEENEALIFDLNGKIAALKKDNTRMNHHIASLGGDPNAEAQTNNQT